MDLTEAEDIKKSWQEYTEELYKKDLHDPDNHDGVITHLEPDILECEVKWALGSITTNKAGRGDEIPVQLFQILKKRCYESAALNMPANLEPVCCFMSSFNCYFLTCIQISQEAGQLVWYSHLFQNFPQFVVIHTVKGSGIVNKAEVFLELSYFFDDPTDVGNLIFGSSAFSKSSLNI